MLKHLLFKLLQIGHDSSSNSKMCLRDFTVPCLYSITSLKCRFEPKYELHLKICKTARNNACQICTNLNKFKKYLHQQLGDWEKYLMEQSPNEAYIGVENMVDNEGPSRDVIYMTHNILHKDLRHLFDMDYRAGCTVNLNSKK